MNFNGLMAVGLHAGVSLVIFTLINQAQPTAYMDEIFHIPQARKYCYGKFREVVRPLLIIPYWQNENYSCRLQYPKRLTQYSLIFLQWDDKITTLPGMYLVSVGILNPISLLAQRILCEVSHLRLINTVLSSICFLILQRIVVQIHGAKHVSLINKKPA